MYDLVKEFGEGVDRIYRDMEAAGLPDPEYRQSEFMLYATLRNKNWGQEDASWGNEHQRNNQDDSGTLSHSKILKKLIRSNPKTTRKEMAELLGMSERSVQRILNEMPEVKFTCGGRSGHWEIDE